VLLFFTGLSGPLYRTEALRAIIGQSALNGHWLTPTLYGEPFLTKPPGAYAAIGLASLPLGHVTESTARLPSAFAATLTVLFAFATLRLILGDQRAFVAALMLPVSVLWLDKVPSAEIDMLQLAWVACGLLFFVRAIFEAPDRGVGCQPALRWAGWQPTPRNSLAYWIAALLCVAGGFLTKWTAPAFFYLAIIPFLIWRGQWRLLFKRDHLLAVAIASAICIGWAYLVARNIGWSVLYDTIHQEAAQRFAPKANGKPYPWFESLTFPFVVLGATLPWSIPALFALRPSFLRSLDDRTRLLVQLLHCWAWPNLLFWSLPAQHNVRYVLPIAPAITLLGIIVILRWVENAKWRFTSPRSILIATLVLWMTVKVVFVVAIVPSRTAGRNARETGEQLARLVPPGEILYLCRLKDEGVLFYYGRPARRQMPIDPAQGTAVYAILLDAEWDGGLYYGRAIYVAEMRDQQGAPIHLVRLYGPTEDDGEWLPWRLRTQMRSSLSAP
jgi:4-amino-4-deoxy-L-arabinose transferase-like glycosyltransferase